MRLHSVAVALLALVLPTAGVAAASPSLGADGAGSAPRGAPGTWTRITTGEVSLIAGKADGLAFLQELVP